MSGHCTVCVSGTNATSAPDQATTLPHRRTSVPRPAAAAHAQAPPTLTLHARQRSMPHHHHHMGCRSPPRSRHRPPRRPPLTLPPRSMETCGGLIQPHVPHMPCALRHGPRQHHPSPHPRLPPRRHLPLSHYGHVLLPRDGAQPQPPPTSRAPPCASPAGHRSPTPHSCAQLCRRAHTIRCASCVHSPADTGVDRPQTRGGGCRAHRPTRHEPPLPRRAYSAAITAGS